MGPDSIDYDENGEGEVAAYEAFDPETGSITWSWDGDDKDQFLPSSNGSLNFKTPPDHEAPTDKDGDNVYQVTVQASDGTNTGSLPVTITVTNVDEDGTVILSSDQPQTGTALDRHPLRPGWNGKRHNVGMGEFRGWEHRLDRSSPEVPAQ